MSVASQLEQLETDITNAYSAIDTKGGTIPAHKNTNNLATAINSISTGGGGGGDGIYKATTLQGLPNNANDGDLGVVYSDTTRNPSESDTITTVSFPNEVVFTTAIEFLDGSLYDPNTGSSLYIYADDTTASIDINDGDNFYNISYVSNDGLTYTIDNADVNTYTFTNPISWGTYSEDAAKFLIIGGANFGGLYAYDSGWDLANTQFTATNGDIISGKTGYTNSGITTGTLGGSASSSCNDAAATIYAGTKIAYDNMNTITTSPPNDIAVLPVRFDGTPIYDARTVGAQRYCNDRKKLQIVEGLEMTGQTRTDDMFAGCSSLVYVGTFNTASCTYMGNMFRECPLLETVCLLNTQNNTSFNAMFMDCPSLKNVPQFDTSGVTNPYGFYAMVAGCTMLTNDSLNNLLGMCANATSYNGVKTFKMLFNDEDMSSYYPASTIQGLSNYSAFTSAGWTIGWS